MNPCARVSIGVFIIQWIRIASVLASPANVVFMEAHGEPVTRGETPTYKLVSDEGKIAQYMEWLDNDSARLALNLYHRAWATIQSRGPGGE